MEPVARFLIFADQRLEVVEFGTQAKLVTYYLLSFRLCYVYLRTCRLSAFSDFICITTLSP
jgi:hypothetical protein